jgi:four helix bundle protein
MDRYEDFDAWKLAHALNMKIFQMTSRPPAVNDYKFRDNIRDAADSAERNFPEGFERFGPKEFARFLDYSKASLLETKNQLRVGLRRRYFKEPEVRDARRLVNRTLGALSGLQRYLRSPAAEDCSADPRTRSEEEKAAHSFKKEEDGRTQERRTEQPRNSRTGGTEEPRNRGT